MTLRDLWADPDDVAATEAVLAELSHLADALLAAALERAVARVAAMSGPATWTAPDGTVATPRFAVLGMGKLGGEELNYSSDVDLIYVLESCGDGRHRAGGVARRILRPCGARARSVGDGHDRGWLSLPHRSGSAARGAVRTAGGAERNAERVLRRLGGDVGEGGVHESAAGRRRSRVRLARHPCRRSDDLPVGDGLRGRRRDPHHEAARRARGGTLRRRRSTSRSAPAASATSSSSPRRCSSCTAAAFAQVRERSTQRALKALAQVGVLPRAGAPARCTVPTRSCVVPRTGCRWSASGRPTACRRTPPPSSRLARALGFTGDDLVAQFEEELEAIACDIRAAFAPLFADEGVPRAARPFPARRSAAARAARRRAADRAARDAVRARHRRVAEPRTGDEQSRPLHPRLGARRFYYGLLLDRPELHRSPGRRCSRPRSTCPASSASHPRLIEPIFSDPNVLVLSRDELRAGLAELRARPRRARDAATSPSSSLDALRLLHNRELVNIGLLDLAEKIGIADAEHRPDRPRRGLRRRRARVGPRPSSRDARGTPVGDEDFLVVAMGKLASRELTYGSDLDVIFLYDVARRR